MLLAVEKNDIMAAACPPIVHSAYIDTPPERVYETLTTPGGWDAWFTSGTQIEPHHGGRIVLRWKDWGPDHMTVEDGGAVIEVVPDRRLAFLWHVGDSVTKVVFELEPRGLGTVIRVTESGYKISAGDLKALIGCATGWGEALTLLKMYLEHGVVYGAVPGSDTPVTPSPPPQVKPAPAEVDQPPSAAGHLLDAEA